MHHRINHHLLHAKKAIVAPTDNVSTTLLYVTEYPIATTVLMRMESVVSCLYNTCVCQFPNTWFRNPKYKGRFMILNLRVSLIGNACKVNVCSDKCTPSPRGAICTCSGNTVLGKDGRKCIPGPPLCLKDPPPCDHQCISTKDSYICSCFEGYNLR